jgi:hypothetical protein
VFTSKASAALTMCGLVLLLLDYSTFLLIKTQNEGHVSICINRKTVKPGTCSHAAKEYERRGNTSRTVHLKTEELTSMSRSVFF